jgi:hypothetical protein
VHIIVAVHDSAVDAVDGSSTGTAVPWMWVLLGIDLALRKRGYPPVEDLKAGRKR